MVLDGNVDNSPSEIIVGMRYNVAEIVLLLCATELILTQK